MADNCQAQPKLRRPQTIMTSTGRGTATVKLVNLPDYPSVAPESETGIRHPAFVPTGSDDHDATSHPSRLA